MEDYFLHVARNLTIEEMQILNVLMEHDCTASFKSLRKIVVKNECEMSEANFRKATSRLEALGFVVFCTGTKQHTMIITEYGVEALYQNLSSEVKH